MRGERQEGKNMRGQNSRKEGEMEREGDLPEQTGIVRYKDGKKGEKREAGREGGLLPPTSH